MPGSFPQIVQSRAETSLAPLITLAHARWVIEQFYKDARQECGLDDFQGRCWEGLHLSFTDYWLLDPSMPPDPPFQQPLAPPGEPFPACPNSLKLGQGKWFCCQQRCIASPVLGARAANEHNIDLRHTERKTER